MIFAIQVVNGPELLQRWVGQSEANIRALFEGAENEYAREGDNAGLYVIIFDEVDALCKARGRDQGGSGVGDSVVNQLLTKLDGVNRYADGSPMVYRSVLATS